MDSRLMFFAICCFSGDLNEELACSTTVNATLIDDFPSHCKNETPLVVLWWYQLVAGGGDKLPVSTF
jgi:hypothetical protein